MTFANLRHLLETRTAETPDKTFLFAEADGREWTYAEFDKAVNRTANMLLANSVGKGDVVSLLMPNSPEYVTAYFACWKLGAIAGPVNSLLKPEEVAWVVTNSESKLILSEPSALAGGQLDCVPDTIPVVTNWPPAHAGGSDLLAETTLTTDDEAIIIYTSGTTGKPKGCLLTHGNLLANAEQITNWMGFGSDDRLLTIMPLFHMNAVTVTTMTALYCGGSTVVSPKFSGSRFWDIIEKYGITSFGSVATMLSMLLTRSEPPASAGGQIVNRESATWPPAHAGGSDSLKFAMCGSAPVPAEVLKRFEETFGVLVIEGYGLSESTCRSSFNPPNENRRPGSCGLPIGNEMAVFDEEDNAVNDGELGEIVLRGPNIFKAYFKNPDATAKAFANGWFHTGDIGYRDTDGFFYIADRKSDMIIRGGENIYPREIDDLLYTHPAIAAAAVIGVPDNLYGEEVAAFIVLKDGYEAAAKAETRLLGSVSDSMHKPAREQGRYQAAADQSISEQDIIDFCKLHLADYKCPKTIHFVDDIPKGPTGKLLKRELAKLVSRA
ncbi:MAG TPA: AMP-binding protein [Pyrinomonadaceae bacterium]|nr:AMP-binding protein [Pyrinomonadaceae bacterium]